MFHRMGKYKKACGFQAESEISPCASCRINEMSNRLLE